MTSKRTIVDKIFLFVKGLSMGAANKVPGVSGGTVSFVLGFYEELIYSFKKINFKALKLLFTGRWKSFYHYINAEFLLLVMGGSMCSYFSISLVLDYLLNTYELYVWAAFFGMILGSIYYIAKDFNDFKFTNVLSIVIGISLGIAISFMPPAQENTNLYFVFFCGIVGVSGMTLPGLSGSFILILMGNYVLLLVDAVNMLSKTILDVFSGNFDFVNNAERIKYLKIVGVFTAGSTFGLIFISHVLGFVLKRWHQLVTSMILGFIIGSLGIVWPWKTEIFKTENGAVLTDVKGAPIIQNYQRFLPDISLTETWLAILYISMGIGIVLLIDMYAKQNITETYDRKKT
ncbi:MAG: DUF368 domain-containing protein [Flavobacteriaceae bacterium]|nr:DUF368 domain-containing protein [Flavobacteriaceae bacterium]